MAPDDSPSTPASTRRADAGEPSGPPPATVAPVPGQPAPPAPLDRRHVALLVTPIIVMMVAVQVGNALFPTLSTENPLLLVALNSVNRNLILAANDAQHWLNAGVLAPMLAYILIGTFRLLAPDPFFYELGWHYGENALGWMERRTPTFGQYARELEKWFAKAGWALVLVMPNNWVCLIAGAARMRKSWFWTLNIIGTLGRLAVMWWIGNLFESWIDLFLDFVREYRWPLLALSVGLVALTGLREWRSGSSEIRQIIELEHEMEDEAPDAPHQGAEGAGGVADRAS